jgi:hypothetical protein
MVWSYVKVNVFSQSRIMDAKKFEATEWNQLCTMNANWFEILGMECSEQVLSDQPFSTKNSQKSLSEVSNETGCILPVTHQNRKMVSSYRNEIGCAFASIRYCSFEIFTHQTSG